MTRASGWARRCGWLPRGLDGQLILFTTASLAVAILGYAAFTANTQAQLASRTLAAQMAALAKNLAEVSTSAVVTGDLTSLEDVIMKTAGFPGVMSILVTDAKGKPLSEVANQAGRIAPRYGSGPVKPPLRGASEADDSEIDDMFVGWHLLLTPHEQETAWQPVRGGRLLGWVRVTYSLEHMRATVVRAWRDALLFSGLAIGAALSLLVVLLRPPMRALKAATGFAGELDSQLGKQLPVVPSTMEIEALGAALNSVSARLESQERVLQETAGFTQRIVDSVVDGIITIDRRGIVQSFNHSASAIFGYFAEEVIGRNVSMLMPEPYRSQHDGYLESYFNTGVAKIIGIGREVEGCRKDGSVFPMELAVSLSAHGGQPLFIGLVRDVSERKRMERMKSEFVSTVSHELRTPLTSISGALGLIVGGALGEVPPQAQQMLGIAHKNSLRLGLLINDLLDMEKLAAGKMTFDLQRQALLPLLEGSLESVRAYGDQYRVRFDIADRSQGAWVNVDGGRLQQVMSNFLSNAAKFSPQGASVEVVAERRGERVRVSVIDHGPGISAEFRQRIFQKFSQADSSDTRQKGGTGLGLAISKALIEHMHGTVGFDSEDGKGACFYFELPVCEDER